LQKTQTYRICSVSSKNCRPKRANINGRPQAR
jgi:hypothetical protein